MKKPGAVSRAGFIVDAAFDVGELSQPAFAGACALISARTMSE